MLARVTTVKLQPDKVAESVALYQQEIVPIVKGQPGFQGMYLLTDAATGNGMSISFWNSEAEAQAYESSGIYRQMVAKLAANFSAPPSLGTFEVTARG